MKNKTGFTIIESLVAIAILVSAIIGATTAVQTGLSSYTFSKDQIIAFYLAQEGFEQIRNIRDANQINNRPWLTGLAAASGDACYYGQACMVDPVASAVATRCTSPGNCPFLRQDSVNGFYGYNAAWPLTRFRREITLSSVNSEEVAVTVTVNWSKGSVTRQFKARENLFNWQ
jgi:prepilin-type N-terminal cleavage/methylation domain-containing protein